MKQRTLSVGSQIPKLERVRFATLKRHLITQRGTRVVGVVVDFSPLFSARGRGPTKMKATTQRYYRIIIHQPKTTFAV
jgi:hypothetical protein